MENLAVVRPGREGGAHHPPSHTHTIHPPARTRTPPPLQWKIWQLFDPAEKVERITESAWHLRAEAVPEEEEGLDQPGALHVQCLQISREQQQVSRPGRVFLCSACRAVGQQ